MQQDRYLQMQSLVLDTINLLQKLASNIGSLLVLVLQEFQELKWRQSQIEQRLSNMSGALRTLNEDVEDLKCADRIEKQALRERNEELESTAAWINGEIRPLSNFYSRYGMYEDDLEMP
jgi:hypothetical protein